MEEILPVRNQILPIKKIYNDIVININDTLHILSFGQFRFTKIQPYWRHLKNISMVYVLIYQDEFIYIGQTSDFAARMLCHSYDKKFDEIITIECDSRKSAYRIESRLIKRYQPKLNIKSR